MPTRSLFFNPFSSIFALIASIDQDKEPGNERLRIALLKVKQPVILPLQDCLGKLFYQTIRLPN